VICPVPDEIHQAFSLQDFYKQGTLQSDYLKENIFLNKFMFPPKIYYFLFKYILKIENLTLNF